MKYAYACIESPTPIGKVFDAQGCKIANQPIIEGIGRACEGTLEEIATFLEDAPNTTVLTTGIPKESEYQLIRKGEAGPGMSRSKENFTFPDTPGMVWFDCDPDHWIHGKCKAIEDYLAILAKALGLKSMEGYGCIVKPSSSSCIYDGDKQITDIEGIHVGVPVTSLAALNNGGAQRLIDLAFSNDCGSIAVSKAGIPLQRTVFDKAPFVAPNNLLYIGEATFRGSHTSQRKVIWQDGGPLDLTTLFARIDTDKAEAEWRRLQTCYKGHIEQTTNTYIAERVKGSGLREDEVRRALKHKILPADWLLTFDDGSQKPVWEFFKDVGRYKNGVTIRDPLEPEYGRSKAKIWSKRGKLFIHSFAHGRSTYTCTLNAQAFDRILADSPEAWESLVPQVIGASLDELAEMVMTNIPEYNCKKVYLKNKMKRGIREAQTAELLADKKKWAGRYAFLGAGSGTFIDLEYLHYHQKILSISQNCLNLRHLADNISGQPLALALLENEIIPTYKALHSQPPMAMDDPIPECRDLLNTWRPGPKIEPDSSLTTKDLGLWYKLLEYLIPDEKEREPLLDWFAYHIQYPGEKCKWHIVFYSKREGMGKDTILEPLRFAMGRHNTTDITSQQLEAGFNEYLLRASGLLIIQELCPQNKKNATNKLKNYCASPPHELPVNVKNERDIEVANTMGLIIPTNTLAPLVIDENDRRWFMLEVPYNLPPKDESFFSSLYAELNGGYTGKIVSFLAGRDLSQFKENTLPFHTDYKKDVSDLTRTSYEVQIAEALDGALNGRTILSTEEVVGGAQLDGTSAQRQVRLTLRGHGWNSRRADENRNSRYHVWVKNDAHVEITGAELYERWQQEKEALKDQKAPPSEFGKLAPNVTTLTKKGKHAG